MSAPYHSGMEFQEMAERLGMSRQNVQRHYENAMAKLRRAMGSKFKGAWQPYDSEGVPAPAADYHDRESLSRPHGRTGKFIKKQQPEAHRVDGMIAECVRKSESEGRVAAAE